MRLAYLDCFAGISGDMFLGALLGAGVPPEVLRDATHALNLGASLEIETVDRSGISAIKVHVLEGGRLAEDGPRERSHAFSPERPEAGDEALPQQSSDRIGAHTLQPRTQHLHKLPQAHTHASSPVAEEHGRDHSHHDHDGAHGHGPAFPAGEHTHGGQDHSHPHTHGRSLSEIRSLIEAAPLDASVKRFAIHTFELLGAAEAKVHNVPVEAIHFHEVGAVDAIVDIVAVSAGIHHLEIDGWHCSPVNLGAGMVRCAHGIFPVPAPATADLLRGTPTYSAHVDLELVTPTGAALLRALEPRFGPQPAMQVSSIGYGAGSRDPHNLPNVLRLSIGEANSQHHAVDGSSPVEVQWASQGDRACAPALAQGTRPESQTITLLETALDDLSPQITAYVAEQALALGALDVMLTPVVMKKGRPGTLLTVLCAPEQSDALESLLLRETSTLGVRRREEQRVCLERRHTTVETPYGPIRIKVGMNDGAERNAAPEFEDCRSAAQACNVPLKQVQQAAAAAYLRQAES